ncbi:MAG TPA: hypothetical protein VK158_02020, partial [Acidobacteriota bacterium]|nr:hypothetical protein [Acidobacteriota bacterium]
RWLHALGRPPYSADFFKKSFSVMLQDGKYVGATYGEVAQKSAPSRRSREVEEEKVKYDLMWDGKPYLLHAECRSDLIRMAPRIGRMGLTMQDGLEKVLQMAPVGARYVDPSSPHRQTIVFGTNPYLRQMIIYDNTILDVSVASSMR